MADLLDEARHDARETRPLRRSFEMFTTERCLRPMHPVIPCPLTRCFRQTPAPLPPSTSRYRHQRVTPASARRHSATPHSSVHATPPAGGAPGCSGIQGTAWRRQGIRSMDRSRAAHERAPSPTRRDRADRRAHLSSCEHRQWGASGPVRVQDVHQARAALPVARRDGAGLRTMSP